MKLLLSTIVLLSCGVALGLPQDFEFLNEFPSSLSRHRRSPSEEVTAALLAYDGEFKGFDATLDPAAEDPQPTIKDKTPFDAGTETTKLIAALDKKGSDGQEILDILGTISNSQRQELLKKYNEGGTRDLRKAIVAKFSGTFETLLLGLLQLPSEFLINELYDGLRGASRREETLIQILCVMTPDQITNVAGDFRTAYQRSLTEYAISTTSGDFRILMPFILESEFRDKTTDVKADSAKTQAVALYNAGEGRSGTDVKTFIQILATENFKQLKEVFDAYKTEYHKTIYQSIKTELTGSVRDGLLAIAGRAQNLAQYYAQCLYGASDAVIKRILISRSEIDLGDIKEEYEKLYQRTLRSDLEKKSGDFKKAVLRLCGE